MKSIIKPMKQNKNNLDDLNSGIDPLSEDYIEKPIAPKNERFSYGPNALSNSLMNVIKKFSKKYGFVNSDVIHYWVDIAGEDLSRKISPVKIVFPFGQRQGGTLHVKIKNASFSSVIQYQFPVIIERVNTYFGYNAISKIKIVY